MFHFKSEIRAALVRNIQAPSVLDDSRSGKGIIKYLRYKFLRENDYVLFHLCYLAITRFQDE